MDRRSGLKKAHFSSVPIRMSLFTCKKYVFLIKKTFLLPHPKIGKLNTTLSSNSMHRSLRVALQVALENSTQRFPMGRVVGRELSFTEDFVVIPTDLY